MKSPEVQLLAGQEHERLHVSAAVAECRAASHHEPEPRRDQHALEQRRVIGIANGAIRKRGGKRIERPARRDAVLGAFPIARADDHRELARRDDLGDDIAGRIR